MPTKKTITPPTAGTFAPYYLRYIDLVKGDPIRLLESQILDFKALLSEIPEEKEEFAYAVGKWTVKEVVGHIIDTERIMAYRALCFARGEKQPLPGFDEDDYTVKANFNSRSLMEIAHEFGVVREATIALFKTFSDEDLDKKGIASNNPVTPRALLYIIAGHHIHHEAVLKERYLADVL
ncbi:MAG TPA: DinB family protein [Bacteroidia bacterium]|nr:DinB family protein [Bacteroidia bacterium]